MSLDTKDTVRHIMRSIFDYKPHCNSRLRGCIHIRISWADNRPGSNRLFTDKLVIIFGHKYMEVTSWQPWQNELKK